MLTRSEMEEILSRHYDETGADADEEFFAALSTEEVVALFEEAFPEEAQRQSLEKSIREYAD